MKLTKFLALFIFLPLIASAESIMELNDIPRASVMMMVHPKTDSELTEQTHFRLGVQSVVRVKSLKAYLEDAKTSELIQSYDLDVSWPVIQGPFPTDRNLRLVIEAVDMMDRSSDRLVHNFRLK